jgi:hypothetical protein
MAVRDAVSRAQGTPAAAKTQWGKCVPANAARPTHLSKWLSARPSLGQKLPQAERLPLPLGRQSAWQSTFCITFADHKPRLQRAVLGGVQVLHEAVVDVGVDGVGGAAIGRRQPVQGSL